MMLWSKSMSSVTAVIVTALVITALTACSGTGTKDSVQENGTSVQIDTSSEDNREGSIYGDAVTFRDDLYIRDIDFSEMFSNRDLRTSWSSRTAAEIRLDGNEILTDENSVVVSGSTATLKAEGTYHISGTLSDGQIIVDAQDNEKVQLVLDGADITCSSSACILVKNADKVFITLPGGSENCLSDTGAAYEQTDDSMNVDAVIFSKTDLVFNGSGSLTVNAGFHDGIVSKDDLKFAGGTYEINAAEKGIVGKDSLRVRDGSFSVLAGDDALHTDREDKTDKGFIYIGGGVFSISAGDDVMHAATAVIIEDGSISISRCYEGFEGRTVYIGGGTLQISSGCGGLDSDGRIIVNGGGITVDGPVYGKSAGSDPGAEILINGGVFNAAGTIGIPKAFSEASSQYSILYTSSEKAEGGEEIRLLDKNDNSVLRFTPDSDWSYLLMSSPDLSEGTYTLVADGQKVKIDVTSVSCRAGTEDAR